MLGLAASLASALQLSVALAQEATDGIAAPLTDVPGNPVRGRRTVAEAAKVTCLICHTLPLPDEPDMGAIGPSLVGIGSRMTEAELRLRIVDPKAIKPDSLMPSYFRTGDLYRVGEEYLGQTIYTAQEVEDVIAYLVSLKESR